MPIQRMQQRRDTAANWTAANPVLAAGEIGYETDTGKLKIGDGTTAWVSLLYGAASLDATSRVPATQLGTGTADSATVLGGDRAFRQITDAQVAAGAAIASSKLSGTVNTTGDQAKTGALTLNDALFLRTRPKVDLAAFAGADPTGASDSTAAIVAAHNHAVDIGGTLWVKGTFLIRPTAGAIAVPWAAGAKVIWEGDGGPSSVLKVADGSGDFLALAGRNTAGAVNDIYVSGLTIDYNTANNPLANAAALVSNPRIGFYVPGGSARATFTDLVFTNGDNIWHIGSGASSSIITRCRVVNQGSATDHDHSSVYVNGDRAVIHSNTFEATGISARTAIETHAAQQVVANNHSTNFTTLANITGIITSGTPSTGGAIHGNTARGCGIGIMLWSRTSGGSTVGLRDYVVHDNLLEVDIDRWHATTAQKVGILFDNAADLPFESVHVHHNIVRFRPFTVALAAADNGSSGIRMERTTGTVTDRNLRVEHNSIIHPPAAGIRINPGASTIRGLSISGNHIVNPGFGAGAAFIDAFKVGVQLVGTHHEVRIANNTVHDDQPTRTMTAGVDVQFLDPSASEVAVVENTVTVADGSSVTEIIGDAGTPVFLRHVARTFAVPTGVFRVGSTVMDLATGFVWRQRTSPSGSTWSVLPDVPAESHLFVAGRYYGPAGARSVVAAVLDQETAVPFWVATSVTVDRIAVEVTVAGTAGALVRLGIRASSTTGVPATLLLDAGTVSATTTGTKELAISQALTPGLYYLTATAQGATCTMRAVLGSALMPISGTLAAALAANPPTGYYQSGVTGGLPSTFTLINHSVGATLVVVRAA